MPISAYYKGKGEKVLRGMVKKYGPKKGKEVFYATAKKQGLEPQQEDKTPAVQKAIDLVVQGQKPEEIVAILLMDEAGLDEFKPFALFARKPKKKFVPVRPTSRQMAHKVGSYAGGVY